MDPYDKEKTRQIWKRVLGDECAQEVRATDSERLRQMITAEKTAVCIFRALSRCGFRDVLQRIACDDQQHSRRLEAIYFLWTGACSETISDSLPQYACMAQALRALHQMKLEAASSYRQAAEELPEFRDVFLGIAEKEQCHAAQLFELLQRCIA